MPLKGVITPDGRELTWDKYLVTDGKGVFPKAVRHALYDGLKGERNRWYSPSSINYCLRKAKWQFERDWYIPQRGAYYFMRGNIIHGILAASRLGTGALVEQEVKAIVPGTDLMLAGQLDLWEDGVLYDYKTLSEMGVSRLLKEGAKAEHIKQANIYAWMLRKEKNIDTEKIVIVYLTMSNCIPTGQEFMIKNRKGEEEEQILDHCPVYTDSMVEGFLTPIFKSLSAGFPPAAEPQDWICKDCYFREECQRTVGRGEAVVQNVTPEIVKPKINIDDLF